jgi:hypothetical protein
VDRIKLEDPGDQLKPVLEFKRKIESEKRYLFKEYATIEEFTYTLDGHLARWLKEHGKTSDGSSVSEGRS